MTALAFVVVALAAYRTWVLLAEDDLLEPARGKLPERWQEWIGCYWCAGFWVAVGWAAAWWADGRAVYAAVPFALSAAVALIAACADRLDG